MAHEKRPPAAAVAWMAALQQEPYRFGFYNAIRHLDCASPDSPRTGEAASPREEHLRLTQTPSLAFAPSTISECEVKGRFTRVCQQFFGLLGPQGPLPLHLTEYAWQRVHNYDDPCFTEFLNLFHHRMLSLFYRAWSQTQPTVQLDRVADDRFQKYVGALFGLGTPSLRNRDAMPDFAKLHFAGRLACQTRSADGLEAILAEFFRLPVRIEQFVGQWLQLPQECLCELGVNPASASLGINTTIGSHVWDCQQKFRIVFGPLNLDDYQRFLPGGSSLERLAAVVRNYIGDEFEWEVKLLLKKEEAPSIHLGLSGQLGWTDWVISEPVSEDRDDLALSDLVQAI